MSGVKPNEQLWPQLPLDAWQDTCSTLHRWSQIIGKIRLTLAPIINHWWQVPFYITSRGRMLRFNRPRLITITIGENLFYRMKR